jgi:tRNA(fMet)-specific endonuclease VapC
MGPVAKVMLDGESCAAILRRSDAKLLARLRETAVGEVCISAVTLAELRYGVEASRRRAQELAALEAFMRHVAVKDFPGSAAADYGVVRMVLELCEAEVDGPTMLAAAHARSLGVMLVTGKAREVGKVQGMMVESWGGSGL